MNATPATRIPNVQLDGGSTCSNEFTFTTGCRQNMRRPTAYRAGVGPTRARSDWQHVYLPLIRAREGAAKYAEPEMSFDDGLPPKLRLS